MATTGTYYINSDSFLTATSIYTDAALTTFAPDGYYKDCGVVRYLTSGVLGDTVACPSCAGDCDTTYTMSEQGVYSFNVELGGTLGVSSVLFNTSDAPCGIYVTYNGTTFTSGVDGTGSLIDGPYFGVSADDCGLVANSPHTLTSYEYNSVSTSFQPVGTSSVAITAGQLGLTAGNPGTLFFVFSYNDATVTQANITVINVCKDSASSAVVRCGVRAGSYQSSARDEDPTAACALDINERYYLVPADGVGTEPATGDRVYQDIKCRVPLEDGFYSATIGGVKKSYEVVSGAVQTIANCAAP